LREEGGVSLRARLTLAFLLVAVVPLAVGAALFANEQARQAERDLAAELRLERQALVAVLTATCDRARVAAAGLLRAGAESPDRAAAEAAAVVRDGGVDGVALLRPDGSLLAAAGAPTGAGSAAAAPDCAARPLFAARVTADGGGPSAVAAVRIVPAALRDAVIDPTHQVLLLHGDTAAGSDPAAVGPVVAALAGEPDRVLRRAGDLLVAAAPLRPDGGSGLVAVSARVPDARLVWTALGLVVLAFAGLTVLLCLRLARTVTRPLDELADAARRVTAGDLRPRIPVTSGGELGRLATAFSTMTVALREHVQALADREEQLRRGLDQLGETLAGTHDLDRILAVVLDAALAATSATGGVVLLREPGADRLELAAHRGLEDRLPPAGITLTMGDGLLGRAAATGRPVLAEPAGGAAGVPVAAGEPAARSVLAVPLQAAGRTLGVLGLYDREDGHPFVERELAVVSGFADQVAVALHNIRLHDEARRLAVTDGLTGVGNYRLLLSQLGRELERATRFDHPLALLMVDLDRFKAVNDDYGHQRGDAALIELARRLDSTVREIDTLVRYGGEEFALVLPETGRTGAERAARRILSAVRDRPFRAGADGPALSLSVSVGIALFPGDGRDGTALLSGADAALYEAKAAGRDTYRLAPTPRAEPGGTAGGG
jgi:two-component system cell cycle response regulator